MRFRTLSPFLSAAIFLSLAGPVSSQEWRGGRVRVQGSVKNEKGEPIEGARIHLRWKQHSDGPDLVAAGSEPHDGPEGERRPLCGGPGHQDGVDSEQLRGFRVRVLRLTRHEWRQPRAAGRG